jgi:hypothetical protein
MIVAGFPRVSRDNVTIQIIVRRPRSLSSTRRRMVEFALWVVGIILVVVVVCAIISLIIGLLTSAAPALVAAAVSYGLLFLNQRRRQHHTLVASDSSFSGFVLTRQEAVINVAVSGSGLKGLVRTGSITVIGGSAAVGLIGIAAMARWSLSFDHVHMWVLQWIDVPPPLAVGTAVALLIALFALVEHHWPVGRSLRAALSTSVDESVNKRRRSWDAITRLDAADKSLARSIETLRGGRGDYVAKLDHFLRGNPSAIVRSRSRLETELRRLVNEAESRESRFREAAEAYSSSREMHGATGRAIATGGNASMFATLEDVLRLLEIAREVFVVSEELDVFLSEVSEIQEWLAGIERLARDASAPSPPRESTSPYYILGVAPEANFATVQLVYRKLINIYHEGSSVAPNEARWKELNWAYRAIVKSSEGLSK